MTIVASIGQAMLFGAISAPMSGQRLLIVCISYALRDVSATTSNRIGMTPEPVDNLIDHNYHSSINHKGSSDYHNHDDNCSRD